MSDVASFSNLAWQYTQLFVSPMRDGWKLVHVVSTCKHTAKESKKTVLKQGPLQEISAALPPLIPHHDMGSAMDEVVPGPADPFGCPCATSGHLSPAQNGSMGTPTDKPLRCDKACVEIRPFPSLFTAARPW